MAEPAAIPTRSKHCRGATIRRRAFPAVDELRKSLAALKKDTEERVAPYAGKTSADASYGERTCRCKADASSVDRSLGDEAEDRQAEEDYARRSLLCRRVEEGTQHLPHAIQAIDFTERKCFADRRGRRGERAREDSTQRREANDAPREE